jgi:hypothetical protein
MFDFLSGQILSVVAARRSGNADGALAEPRRQAELQAPKVPVARGTAAEDQVFLSGATPPPAPPIPVKPSQPTETGNRVQEALRRLRALRRKSRHDPPDPDQADHEEEDSPSAGHRFDRWA